MGDPESNLNSLENLEGAYDYYWIIFVDVELLLAIIPLPVAFAWLKYKLSVISSLRVKCSQFGPISFVSWA